MILVRSWTIEIDCLLSPLVNGRLMVLMVVVVMVGLVVEPWRDVKVLEGDRRSRHLATQLFSVKDRRKNLVEKLIVFHQFCLLLLVLWPLHDQKPGQDVYEYPPDPGRHCVGLG